MKASATLLFWIGCIAIILFAAIQLVFPGFPALFFIIIAVIFCIRQWYRKVHELKNLTVLERQRWIVAERFIKESMSLGGQQRKKK